MMEQLLDQLELEWGSTPKYVMLYVSLHSTTWLTPKPAGSHVTDPFVSMRTSYGPFF
ncbi:hypothetical protein ACP0I7_27630 [Pseudomonas aeruginosa]